jgi:tetratricopeptide (TPR) repeat protein
MKSRKFLAIVPLALLVSACSRDPKVQAQRYLDNGNKFFAKAKYKEASIMYRRALQKDLKFGEAYYRLGLTNLKLASYSDAAKMLRRAVDLLPDNVDATSKLADLYLVASAQDSAHGADLQKEVKELGDRLLQANPDSYEGHRLEGQLALLNMDLPAALKEFAQANQSKPYQTDVVLAYFQALAASGRSADAEKLARELIAKEKAFAPIYDVLYVHYLQQKKVDDAEAVLKLKIENNPQQAKYLLQLAGHYFSAGRRPEMDAVIARLADEKQHPEGHLLAGDFFLFRLHEFDRAQQQYEAAITAFPKEKAIYQKRLVELFASTGKNNDANQLLAAILKDNPKDADAVAMRAALMLQTGNRDQINLAVNDLQSLVTKTPQNHQLRFNLARALVAKGDLEAARLQLEGAIKIRTDFILARELLAKIYLAKRDSARALKEADEIIGLDRNNLQARLIRSNSLLGVGDKDKARQELDGILKAYPQNVDARYQVGFLAWQDKDFKIAEQVFGQLHKENPSDLRGLVGVVETLASQNRLNDAMKEMRTAAERDPQRRDLKLALANLEVRAQRYDEAIQIFQTLLETDPRSNDLLFRLGETLRRNGELNQAIDTFRRASQVAPNDTNSLLQLGLLMDGTGKRDQAKPIYEQILKIQPDHPVALNNLAFIKAEEGTDLDQALTMAQRALQKMPNSPELSDTLGWIYIKKNLSEDAVRVFHDLIAKDPSNPTFRYHYAMALLQKGDKPSARRELETAMKGNPSKDVAGKIHELLAKN